VTGRVFDLTGSYFVPFALCAALFGLGAFITTMVYPAPGHDAVPAAQGTPPTAVALETLRG
jgi:hypothetical protein